MGTPNTGIFDNVSNVKASLDANYIRPGHYAFLVQKGSMQQNRNHEDMVILEMVCVKVFPDSNSFLPEDAAQTNVRGHFVGERASWVIKNAGNGKDMFLPNIKACLMNVCGIADTEVTKEIILQAFPPQGVSALANVVVEVSARNRKSNKTGKTYTAVTFGKAIDHGKFAELGIQLPAGFDQQPQQS